MANAEYPPSLFLRLRDGVSLLPLLLVGVFVGVLAGEAVPPPAPAVSLLRTMAHESRAYFDVLKLAARATSSQLTC